MTSSIILKSPTEIAVMEEANQIVARTLAMLKDRMEPGITTLQLDQWAEKALRKEGAKPAFKGYRGFPATLCVSLNEQVVHGIPSRAVKLREGDILSIDCGVKHQGFFGDAAITVPVGHVSARTRKLIDVTRQALVEAIGQVVAGNRISDVSGAVEQFVEKNGFSVVRQFVGHGIGKSLHEAPEVPNFRSRKQSPKLMPGMVIAIEPMVNIGTHEVKTLRDGWTVVTKDRALSAHFEHSVAVTENGPLVLSAGTEG